MQILLWDLSSVACIFAYLFLKDTMCSKKMKYIKKLKWQQFRISCIYKSEDIFSEWCLIPSKPQMKSTSGNINAPFFDVLSPQRKGMHDSPRDTVLSAYGENVEGGARIWRSLCPLPDTPEQPSGMNDTYTQNHTNQFPRRIIWV